jgi:hypothetical protein
MCGNKGLVKCLNVGRKIQQVCGNKGLVNCLCLTDGEICLSTFRTRVHNFDWKTSFERLLG